MNKFFWSSLLSISLLTAVSPSKACGPSLYPDESRMELFRNGINGYDGMEAFYYTEHFMNSDVPDPQGLDYQRNCEEWKTYTKDASVNVIDIYSVQYQTYPEDFFEALDSKDWSKYKKNTFVQWLLQPKNVKEFEYFILAKRAEATQFNEDYDPWTSLTDEQLATKQRSIDSIQQVAIKMVKKSKPKFLKTRYAFQAMKMSFYAGANANRSAIEGIFQKYLKGSNSVVEGWSYHFMGMMQDINSETGIKYLLRGFDLSEEKKLAAYKQLLRYDMDKVARVGLDNKELQEPTLAMLAFYNKGRQLELIKKLYAVNPKSKYLPFLITREINKIEDWIWSYDILGFDNVNDHFEFDSKEFHWHNNEYVRINQKRDWSYFQQVLNFAETVYAEGKTDAAFSSLALVHLYNLRGDYAKAQTILSQNTYASNTGYYPQSVIEQILITSQLEDILSDKVKAKLANLLNYIKEERLKKRALDAASDYYSHSHTIDDLGELMVYLSKRYKAQGDIVTAGLLQQNANVYIDEYGYGFWNDAPIGVDTAKVNPANNYSNIVYFDKYASVEDVYRLIMLKHKKNKTAFEQFIMPKKWASDDMYYDLIGTKYVREEQYKQALDVFEKMDDNFWATQYAYADYLPTTSIFDLGSETAWDKTEKRTYSQTSKKEVLRDIVAVQEQLETQKLTADQRADLLWKIGKAQLNMTYYGEFWMMQSYGQTYREDIDYKGNVFSYSFYPNSILYGANYYQTAAARQVLDKALAFVKNKELKANIAFTRKLAGLYGGSDYKLEGSKFADIKGTFVYEDAITTCPDILN